MNYRANRTDGVARAEGELAYTMPSHDRGKPMVNAEVLVLMLRRSR